LSIDCYECLLKGLLTHETIEYLDLSNNNLSDKCGNMIARIISRQSQRRDQFVWMLSLRNEKPLNNDFSKGLISINLANNAFGSDSAEELANALTLDCYIRNINLMNNSVTEEGCKKLIKALRKNTTLLNIDLR